MLRVLYPHSFTEFSLCTYNGVFEALAAHYLEVLLCFKRQPLMSSPMLSVSFNWGLKTSLPTGNRQIMATKLATCNSKWNRMWAMSGWKAHTPKSNHSNLCYGSGQALLCLSFQFFKRGWKSRIWYEFFQLLIVKNIFKLIFFLIGANHHGELNSAYGLLVCHLHYSSPDSFRPFLSLSPGLVVGLYFSNVSCLIFYTNIFCI